MASEGNTVTHIQEQIHRRRSKTDGQAFRRRSKTDQDVGCRRADLCDAQGVFALCAAL